MSLSHANIEIQIFYTSSICIYTRNVKLLSGMHLKTELFWRKMTMKKTHTDMNRNIMIIKKSRHRPNVFLFILMVGRGEFERLMKQELQTGECKVAFLYAIDLCHWLTQFSFLFTILNIFCISCFLWNHLLFG